MIRRARAVGDDTMSKSYGGSEKGAILEGRGVMEEGGCNASPPNIPMG